MKKRIKVFIILLLLITIVIPKEAKALTASLSCSSGGSVTLGNTITVTISGSASTSSYWEGILSYDTSKLSLVSGNARPFTDAATSRPSFTYTFKAIGTGSAYVKMSNMNISDELANESPISIASSTCTINVVNQSTSSGGSSSSGSSSSSNAKKNSDNNLKSLSIEGATITPEFNKDTLEYSVVLPSSTTKVNVVAEKNDSKASISGNGEKEVVEGTNKIEVVVTAENGSTKTYIINAIVEEKEPIVVKVSGDKFNVIRKKDVLEAPEGYTETTVVINGEEIPAYSNGVTGYLLVGLNDSKGEAAWYIYDEDEKTYTKYTELKSDSLRLILLEPDKDDIPYKYYENTFEMNGQNINGYTFDAGSDFRLIYAMNIETGEKLFYVYDIKDKTLQRFYNAQVLIYIELVKKCKYLLLGVGVGLIMLFTLLLISLGKNLKFKKQYLSKLENIKTEKTEKNELPKEEVKYKDIEATKVMDKVEDEIVDKKELKKQLKEEKKKLKKERKTFLDE